ncbi:MAG: hypothetical protein JW795_19340 [Chitinivibrionales bacterium]|nr:hypothetical protein [Chitinivibrionales bacterium]
MVPESIGFIEKTCFIACLHIYYEPMESIEYYHLLLRQWKLIVVVMLLVLTLAAIYIARTPKIYEATCKLLIVANNENGPLEQMAGSDLMVGTLGKSDPIATQLEVIKTRPILSEVIRHCNLAGADGKPLKTVQFMENIKASISRNTNIIKVSLRHPTPEQAAQILNTLAQVVVKQNQKLNQDEIHTTRTFIETQLALQKAKLEEAEMAVLDLKKQKKTVAMDLQTKSRLDAITNLETERMKLERELQGALAQQKQLEKTTMSPDAQTNSLYAYNLNTIEQIKSTVTNIMARKSSLDTELSRLNSNLAELPLDEVTLIRLQRDEKIAGEIYMNLLTQYEEYKIKEAAKVASVKIIEPAEVPDIPVLPQKKKTISFAVVLGLSLGIFLAFLREHMDTHPKSLTEIKRALPYGILGAIPVLDKKTSTFYKDDPASFASDCMRLIYANLKYKGIDESKHFKIMITSAQPGEGRTTIAVNLALAFAAAGKKTAYVNLDLRRGMLQWRYDTNATKESTRIGAGRPPVLSVATKRDGTSLDMIDAVTIVSNPAEPMAVDGVHLFLSEVERCYEVCVFDSAPIPLAAETLGFARFMDGIVLVLDPSNTEMKNLTNMHQLFEGKNLPILGVVINKAGSGKIRGEELFGFGAFGRHGKATVVEKHNVPA